MKGKKWLWGGWFLLVGLIGLFWVWQPAGSQANNDVIIMTIEAPVSAPMLDYFKRGIRTAEDQNASAVVIILDTPGGAVDIMQEIVQLIRNAAVPIIIYVGPAGAQAASAGSIITLAGHASGMAPETVIGAASVVDGSGEDLPDTLARKLTEDLQALVRGLAERRGPEAVDLAERMISEAIAVNSQEALAIGFIDAIAVDVPDLLQQLDGQTVIVNNQPETLELATASQTALNLNFAEQLLFILTNSVLIGILLTIGVQAILIELSNPGGWVAGFIGVVAIALALYGLGQLPVNWFGMALIVIAFALFIAEVKVQSGALAIVGVVTLLAGFLVLFNSPDSPDFIRLSLPWAIGITLASSGMFLFVLTKAVQAQRRQPMTGQEGLMGQKGVVRRALVEKPAGSGIYSGMVLAHGELWQATSDQPIEKNRPVRIQSIDGFTLMVAPASLPSETVPTNQT